ncbi:protein HIRA-like isoform X2 [Oscarella lobularis]|uniref:protein HIRA-like isoform X2 n=1 Tax=Oscarella lobularis TaxID=121494 RepID=UPI0033135326
MKLLKPAWIGEDGKPLYSIDIHPDGTRFATGGQGDDSGQIVVWNMAPVRSESDEKNEKVPKILCTMTNHLGCVNCVRWSHEGGMLASGADDGLVMIWEHRASQLQFGSAEVWSCSYILKRHEKDVLDLAWSPDDSKLATCSIDNTIRIWDAQNLPDLLATVIGHDGHVKGVTWDPVGKYLASQSVDKTVKIWRTSDWKEETTIRGPFEGCGETTYVLRLSWSPDGQTVVSAHALNNQGPVAKIIQRDGWNHGDDFVGHRKAVEVVKFNPRLLTRNGPVSMYSCCAVGSRDRSLSIWLTSLKRPLVVTHDIFKQSIIDLSWNSSGYELMLCSLDGTVAYIEFTQDELGRPITNDEKDDFFIENYGYAVGKDGGGGQKLIENPDILGLQLPSSLTKTTTTALSQPIQAAASQNSVAPPSQPPPPPPPPATAFSASSFSGTVKGIAVASSTHQNSPVKEKQKETKTKDGRRRITPVALGMRSITGSPAPSNQTGNVGQSRAPVESKVESAASTTPSAISIKISNVKLGRPKGSLATKRKKDAVGSPAPKKPKNGKITSSFSERSGSEGSVSVSLTSTTGISLPPSRLETIKSLQISSPSGETVTLEVRNSALAGRIHRLSCRKGEQVQWETCIGSRCIAIAGSRNLAAVACENKTIHTFTSNGKRLFPGLVLPSLVSILQCFGYYMMAITIGGQLFVWNSKQKSVVIKGESLGPILKTGTALSLTKVQLTEEGIPIVSLSNQTSCAFDSSLGTWILLQDASDSAKSSASIHSYISGLDFALGPLASIQGGAELTRRQGVERLQSLDAGHQRLATEAYLESQVASALTLRSSKEYHFWLLAYVKCLTKQGIERKLRDICLELAGPPTPVLGRKGRTHDSFILGFLKHDLLKELLSIMASNSSLQRLISEIHEQIQ